MPGKIDKEEESYIVRDAKRATAKERYEAADKEAKHAEAELKKCRCSDQGQRRETSRDGPREGGDVREASKR